MPVEKPKNTAPGAQEPWWMDHVRQIVMEPAEAGSQDEPAASADETAEQGRPSPPEPPPPAGAPASATLQECQERVARLTEDLDRAMRDLNELARVSGQDAASPEVAGAPAEEVARAPDLTGSTGCLSTANIVELLGTNRKSGTLRVACADETFTLEILEGDVVHASSDRYTQEQLLGSILVAREKIGVEQLEDFYRKYTPAATGSEGASEGEDLVSREDLKSALEAQVQELFNRLYAAEGGTYCFFEGEGSNVEQRIRMNVTRLLLESARTADELGRRGPKEETEAD